MKANIGLELSPPKEKCADAKCSWHGSIPVRGKVISGIVRSSKPRNTAIVEWAYHKFVTKYERYSRTKSKVSAHNPPCMHAKEGDKVLIAECRPLSKTKSFVIVSIEKKEAKLFIAKEAEKVSEKKARKEQQVKVAENKPPQPKPDEGEISDMFREGAPANNSTMAAQLEYEPNSFQLERSIKIVGSILTESSAIGGIR